MTPDISQALSHACGITMDVQRHQVILHCASEAEAQAMLQALLALRFEHKPRPVLKTVKLVRLVFGKAPAQ